MVPRLIVRVAAVLVLGSCGEVPVSDGLDPAPVTPPVIALAATTADFTALERSLAPAQIIAISNAGGGTLGGLALEPVEYFDAEKGWLTVSLGGASAPTMVSLQAAAGTLPPGGYSARVKILATGASNSPKTIDVSFQVVGSPIKPIIGLAATAASFSGSVGASVPPQAIAVMAGNEAPLTGIAISDITYGPGAAGWLDGVLDSTTAPTTLHLTPRLAGLTEGTYTAVLVVSASGAINSPRTVRVTLTVTPTAAAPAIRLTTTGAGFSATAGGSAPAPQSVGVTNGGGGTLDGLALGSTTYSAGGAGWLTPGLSSTAAPASVSLAVDPAGLGAGTYTATVPVTSPSAANSPQTITVTLSVAPGQAPPSISLSPVTVSFAATAGSGSPPVKTVAVSNGGGGTLGGLSLQPVVYGAGASGWLSASLSAATAPATVTLTPNTAALAAGTYTATVRVASGVAGNSPQSVAVSLSVSANPLPPSIALSTSSAAFSATAGGASPAPAAVAVSNGGAGTLTGLAVGAVTYGTGATGWLAASLSGSSAPAVLTLTPTLGARPAGTYTATVPVTAPGVGNSPQTVSVTFTVAPAPVPPALALAPSSLSFTGTVGGAAPAAKTVTVTNAGAGTLNQLSVGTITYGAGASGWAAATLSGTAAPATVSVTVAPAGLAAGTYAATVPIASAVASNTPQSITVTFTVSATAPAPAIGLAPTVLTFSAPAGGASPAAKTVAVSNTGGGTLNGLAVGTVTYGAGASGWVTASLSGAAAPATLTVTPVLGSLAAGTYTATVPVTAGSAGNSPQTVAVTFTVTAPVGGLSFATDIYPILQTNCVMAGCHAPPNINSPDMRNLATAYSKLVGTSGTGTSFVTPGDSTVGRLVGALEWQSGFKRMPPSGSKLSRSLINQIKLWIQQGAKNN